MKRYGLQCYSVLLGMVLACGVSAVSAKQDGKENRSHSKQPVQQYRVHDDDDDAHYAREHDDDDDESFLEIGIFGDREREIIRDFYRDHPPGSHKKPLPPGLKKKVARGGDLPPGWQKKLARGEVLDDDVLYHAHGIPDELYGRLPRHPDGTVMVEVGGKVVRLIEATRTIVDVLDL